MRPATLIARGIGLALLLFATAAHATSEEEVNRIINSLAPIEGQTRADLPGVQMPTARPEVLVEVVIDGRTFLLDRGHAIDMEVYFPFDSAELTDRARASLLALGRALESPDLRPYRYLIAGHTDAAGRADYNLGLSERRARAVRDFLVRNYAIHPDRVLSVGFGEERLKVPSEPRASVNRRVEVGLIASEGRAGAMR